MIDGAMVSFHGWAVAPPLSRDTRCTTLHFTSLAIAFFSGLVSVTPIEARSDSSGNPWFDVPYSGHQMATSSPDVVGDSGMTSMVVPPAVTVTSEQVR